MKKNTIKAFTLVEMLIVIVIIGILIAALMPRMQSAQWRARDVARKNDLSQIQTAIVTSQQDKWQWPGTEAGSTSDPSTKWIAVKDIEKLLLTAWMSAVPWDPLKSNQVSWLWDEAISEWEYGYLVATKNWTAKWWFVLMAKTEIEWWSNWIYCANGKGKISTTTDLAKDVQICTRMEKLESWDCDITDWVCKYTQDDQLRYIVIY